MLLAKAIVRGGDPTDEAVTFLRSMGDDPRALRTRLRLVEGDAFALRQAMDLAEEVLAGRATPALDQQEVG